MNYKIKKFKPEHKKEILAVWEKSVLATHLFLTEKDFVEIKEILQGIEFEKLNLICLMDNDKVIGFIGLQDTKIEMLFLDPAYFGKGLGYKLVEYAMSTFKANLVDVNEQNINAKNFYERIGFQVYERTEKDDLGKNYPLLRMKIETDNDKN